MQLSFPEMVEINVKSLLNSFSEEVAAIANFYMGGGARVIQSYQEHCRKSLSYTHSNYPDIYWIQREV